MPRQPRPKAIPTMPSQLARDGNHPYAHDEQDAADIRLLQGISSQLISERSIDALYERIVDAAITIMRSDYSSMQMLYPERGQGGELRLLACRGFNPRATSFWEWVRADSKSTCGAALATGKRVLAPDIAHDAFMAGSEDREVYLDTGIRACQTTPLIGRNGDVVGMISTHWRTPHQPSGSQFRLFDILARQAADLIERTRREEELTKQANLLDLSGDAIIVRDMDGCILYWNRGAEQLYGWTRQQAMGKNIHNLLRTKFPEPFERITDQLLRTGRWSGELVHTTRHNRQITVLCRKVLDRDLQGRPAAVLETNTDNTERKRLEERLHRTEKMAAKGQLAATLAHEINNPLSSVTNALYLIAHSTMEAEARRLLTVATGELARVSRIVKQSLSYQSVNNVPQELDLARLLEESLQAFCERFRTAGIQVTKKLAPGAQIMGFPDEIRQVVDNLLLNAVEAMPHGGRLLVTVSPFWQWSHHRRAVRLTIADTGCGIASKNQPHIFEPFFTTKDEKGSGLSLWANRMIVAKHDGWIRMRSTQAKDRSGTVFCILWPCSSQVHHTERADSESAA